MIMVFIVEYYNQEIMCWCETCLIDVPTERTRYARLKGEYHRFMKLDQKLDASPT